MNAERLLQLYDRVSDAPDAIPKLRRFILDLAVRGKLVKQDSKEESSLESLSSARRRLEEAASTTKRLRWKPSTHVSPEQIPKKLPQGWVFARVNDTGLYINGLAFKPTDWKQTGLPIIRIQNLTDPTKEFNFAEGEFPDEVIVRDGDLLVSWSATLEAFKWDRGIGVLNQHIFRVIPDEGLSARPFLLLLLRNAIREMAESEHAHGLAMMHINRGPFLEHIVLIPPLAEQHRIVAKFDELMAFCDSLEAGRDKREATRDRLTTASLGRLTAADVDEKQFKAHADFAIKVLPELTTRPDQIKAMRQTILDLAVRGKLVEQDPNDEPFNFLRVGRSSSSGTDARQAKISPIPLPFEVPEGWVWLRLDDVLKAGRSISYGVIKLGAEPRSGGISVLRCSDVRPGYIDLSEVRSVSEEIESRYLRTRLVGGEILINIRGTLGGVALVEKKLAGFNVAREVAVVPVTADLCGPFLVYVMLSRYFWAAIQRNLRGIAYKGLNLSILRRLEIPLPPIAEQNRIVAKLDELMSICDGLEHDLISRQRIRTDLLEVLLSGALEPTIRKAA